MAYIYSEFVQNLTNATLNMPLVLAAAKVNKFAVQKFLLGSIPPLISNIRPIRLPDSNKFVIFSLFTTFIVVSHLNGFVTEM
jgi:hypothetical protein